MPRSTVYTRTLTLAAQSLGGVQPLAQRLKVEPAALQRWIAGEEFPPHEVFLQALDIVAAGPRVDPAGRSSAAGRTQAHADRLQAAANRVRESAERLQSSAELAQAHAELMRAHQARANPEHSSGQFRQVNPKDGAPASNKPAEDEKKQGERLS